MKNKSRFKVLSGVGKRWKVKYFDSYTEASTNWNSFAKLKKPGFAVIYDFQAKEYNRITVKNGKFSYTGWKYFKNIKPSFSGW